jgi:hypothetical protein
MTAEPVAGDAIETLLDAARWAPTAGNRHLRRFVATDDPAVLRVLRASPPACLQRPTAAITICTDRALATRYGSPPDAPGLSVDVGTTMATPLPAAHAIGVGAGPVTPPPGMAHRRPGRFPAWPVEESSSGSRPGRPGSWRE